MSDDADLDRRLARLFEEGRRRDDPEDHPAPEKLSAYHAKELPLEEAGAIQEHLVQCAFCTDLLLDLEGFLEPKEEEEREGVADLGTEAGWRKVREEMGWTGEPAAVDVSRLRRSLRAFQALAAVLLVGVVGVSLYSLHLLQERKTPRVNSISSFVPNSEGLRASEVEPELIELPHGEETSLTLTLDDHDVTEYPEYHAEIRHKRGQVLLTLNGLRRQSEGFNFTIDSQGFEPGIYEIELHGLGKGPPARVGYYVFKIERK